MCQCYCNPVVIKNPNQLELKFPIDCYSESYQNGYSTGIKWDANWHPGGPHGFDTDSESHRKQVEWQAGFKRGLAERLKNDPDFAKWWGSNQSGTPVRYYAPIETECEFNSFRFVTKTA